MLEALALIAALVLFVSAWVIHRRTNSRPNEPHWRRPAPRHKAQHQGHWAHGGK